MSSLPWYISLEIFLLLKLKIPGITIPTSTVDFKVVGNKDKYTISFKGDKIQFFVKDNEIIGFLDVEKNSKIYYYEKAEVKEGEDKNV